MNFHFSRARNLAPLALLLWAASSAHAAGAVSALSVRQPITQDGGLYKTGDEVDVDYSLRSAKPVTVSVWSARPAGTGARWYADASTLLARFPVASNKAGAQHFTFKLSALKTPSVPLPGVPEAGLPHSNYKDNPEWVPGALPGRMVVEVAAGGDNVVWTPARFRPVGQVLSGSRFIDGFIHGSTHDSQGHIVAADFKNWRASRYSPDFTLEGTFPATLGGGQASVPGEAQDAFVDSHDNAYVFNASGIYKFDSQGRPAGWSDNSDYLKYPYPSEIKNVLGVRIDENAKEPKQYVFGPGGGGAGAKNYGPDAVKNPGFVFRWGGATIYKDEIYLVRAKPDPQVQVFDLAGKFARAVSLAALPADIDYLAARATPNGRLWLAASNGNVYGLNNQSGAVEKTVAVSTRTLHVGPDGTLYALEGSRVRRFNGEGQPIPFGADVPGTIEAGNALELQPAARKLPDGAPGTTKRIFSVVGNADGSFTALTNEGDNYGGGPLRALRFARNGRFLPDTVEGTALALQNGNVFVGAEAGQVGASWSNIGDTAQSVAVRATIKNLDGETIGTSEQTYAVAPRSLVWQPLSLGSIQAPGYYEINLEARSGGRVVLQQQMYGGRVPPRGHTFPAYSPFGSVRMEDEPELLRRAGGGLSRNHQPIYWDAIEPKPGQWKLAAPDTMKVYRDRYAMPAMIIMAYGEPWLEGGFPNCRIYRYDTWFDYAARVTEQHKNTALTWQFWNEPNFFWHVPGEFRYEHYAQMLQYTYAIAKAKDPETRLICDGFAGSAHDMGDLAGMGAAGWTDGVPIHYPGATTLAFDKMPINGGVETKAPMVKELAAIRDKSFPGKEILNTEEGLWGLETRTIRSGPELLARIYVSQIAAGCDRLTWFEAFSPNDPSYLLRGFDAGPYPTYFAYATASRFLENAQYVGASGEGLAQSHVFAVAGKPLVVAWSIQGERDLTLPATGALSVTDWQGNTRQVAPKSGQVTLHLGPSALFIEGVNPALLAQVAAKRLAGQTPGMLLISQTSLDLNTLFHAERDAEVQALLPGVDVLNSGGELVGTPAMASRAVEAAHTFIQKQESDGRYLKQARTALESARRADYFMRFAAPSNPTYAARLALYVAALARQVELIARSEKVWYPGVMLRVALDTSALRAKTPDKEPLDEKFNPQVAHKPGETVELEMTVYNWTKAPLVGEARPVVPAGWVPAQTAFPYSVAPNAFQRFTTTVAIPADAPNGVYPMGMETTYKGSAQRELHTHRVSVVR